MAFALDTFSAFAAAGSGTVNIETTSPNTLLVSMVEANFPNITVTSNPALTWTQRAKFTNTQGFIIAAYWAVAPMPGTYAVTVTGQGVSASNYLAWNVVAITGADLVNPFDTHPSLPKTGENNNPAIPIVFSTSNPDTIALAAWRVADREFPLTHWGGPPSGWTAVSDDPANPYFLGAIRRFDEPQNNASVTYQGTNNGFIVDAVVPAPGGGPGGGSGGGGGGSRTIGGFYARGAIVRSGGLIAVQSRRPTGLAAAGHLIWLARPAADIAQSSFVRGFTFGQVDGTHDGDVGFWFVPAVPLRIAALGRLILPADTTATTTLNLYTGPAPAAGTAFPSGQRLGTVTVDNVVGEWAWGELATPITVAAGSTYWLKFPRNLAGIRWANPATVTDPSPDIASFGFSSWNIPAAPASNQILGPCDFQYRRVPSITISPIGTQSAGVPFTVSGTLRDFSVPPRLGWMVYNVWGGNQSADVPYTTVANPSSQSWTVSVPGLPVGTYTFYIMDDDSPDPGQDPVSSVYANQNFSVVVGPAGPTGPTGPTGPGGGETGPGGGGEITQSGHPSIGFAGYSMGVPWDPSLAQFVAALPGAAVSQFPLIQHFGGEWSLYNMTSWSAIVLQELAQSADYSPASGRSLVWGSWATASGDGSFSPADICAGAVDSYIREWIAMFANYGYTTANGYTGTIFVRINWEQNYHGTTPGNFNSVQSGRQNWNQGQGQQYAWGPDGVPGTSNYGTGAIGAWRHLVTVMRDEAQLRGVPISIVWNPHYLPYGSGNGDHWSAPEAMYPGDDACDVHSIDIYANQFWPNGWWDYPGYINQPPMTTGVNGTPSASHDSRTWATITGDYSNAAHHYDFTSTNNGTGDGLDNAGWGMYKGMCYSLVIGPYAQATNPNGSPRVAKPFSIGEFGGLADGGGGNGPFSETDSGGGPVVNDPHFFHYIKSRIAWFQAQGGEFLWAALWNGPNNTRMGPAMSASFAEAWPPA